MSQYDDNPYTTDGIPLLNDMIFDEFEDDLPPLMNREERQAFIEKLAYELQNTFRSHTYQVIHGILDGSPEQQDQQLFLRIRELLKQTLPEQLHAPEFEVKRDESDS